MQCLWVFLSVNLIKPKGTTSLTFNNSTFCPHTVFMCYCVDLRTNSEYFPIQHLLTGLYIPHSGHCMYRTLVTICTTSLTFNNSTFCPHTVFMCFVCISEQTAIISLYNINWLVFITQTLCVYCAVRTIDINLPLTLQYRTASPLYSPSSGRCSLVPVRPSRYPALQSETVSSAAPQNRPQCCPPAPRGTLHTVPSPHRLPPLAMSHPAPTSSRKTSNRNYKNDVDDYDDNITGYIVRNVSFIMSL